MEPNWQNFYTWGTILNDFKCEGLKNWPSKNVRVQMIFTHDFKCQGPNWQFSLVSISVKSSNFLQAPGTLTNYNACVPDPPPLLVQSRSYPPLASSKLQLLSSFEISDQVILIISGSFLRLSLLYFRFHLSIIDKWSLTLLDLFFKIWSLYEKLIILKRKIHAV